MRASRRFFCALGGLVFVACASAIAATNIEGTPPPVPPKPDFSSMQFLIGTWTCTDVSSRRPGPFKTTEVYSMDPSGYWLVRDLTVHTASWIPREIKSQTKYTFDPYSKRWVRIVMGELGGYSVATAPEPMSGKKTYTFAIQSRSPNVASYAPEVMSKVSDTKKTMTTTFTETSGRVVHAAETCSKT